MIKYFSGISVFVSPKTVYCPFRDLYVLYLSNPCEMFRRILHKISGKVLRENFGTKPYIDLEL